jgi:hypothetical protein
LFATMNIQPCLVFIDLLSLDVSFAFHGPDRR